MNSPSNKNTIGPLERASSWVAPWVLLSALLVGNAVFLSFNAFRIFVLPDMGPYLDACWRIINGQKLYVDFIFPEGPMHLQMLSVFFRIFGFGKAAILAHLVFFHSLVIVAVFLILGKRIPLRFTLAVTALTVPSFYWTVSHPWHDQSAHVWGVLAMTLLIFHQPFVQKREAFGVAIVGGFLAVLSLMCKTNLGAQYLIIFFLAFLFGEFRRAALKGYLWGIFAGLAFSLFFIPDLAAFAEQNWLYGQRLSGRLIERGANIRNWPEIYFWMTIVGVGLGSVRPFKQTRVLWVLFCGVSVMTILSNLTGGMRAPANITLWGIHMALAFCVLFGSLPFLEKPWQRKVNQIMVHVLLALTVFLIVLSAQRGWNLLAWNREPGIPDSKYYALQTGPLKGWRMVPAQGIALDRLSECIRRQIPTDQTVLNLADFYIIYALTGRESYRGISYQYLSNSLPNPGLQTAKVKEHILTHLPDWVIVHGDSMEYELKYLDLQKEIPALYHPVLRVGFYFLMKRNGRP